MKRVLIAAVLIACLFFCPGRALAGCASNMHILASKFSLPTLFMPMKTNRALADYVDLLGPQLGWVLSKLGSDDLWVDVGGGQAVAQRQYQRVIPEIFPEKARTVNLELMIHHISFCRRYHRSSSLRESEATEAIPLHKDYHEMASLRSPRQAATSDKS